MAYRLVLLVVAVLLAQPLAAELVNCDGVWTDKGCDGEVTESLPVSDPTEAAVKAQPELSSSTEIALHDLNMLRLRARREYEIEISSHDSKSGNPILFTWEEDIE